MESGNCDNGCSEIKKFTPATVYNPHGLASLAYRVGTHGRFKAQMISDIGMERSLGNLTTREDNDLSIALIDSWATIADVLTFYQERIANEGFLRTATERNSVLELARSIGYELRPGVAAKTFLAFTMEDSQGNPEKVTVEEGTRVQSIPSQDQYPQIFETSEKIEARQEYNKMKPRLTQKQDLYKALENGEVYFDGTSTRLNGGDGLLFLISDTPVAFRVIREVRVEVDRNRTCAVIEKRPVRSISSSVRQQRNDGTSTDKQATIDFDTSFTYSDLKTILSTRSESDLQTKASLNGWSVDEIARVVNSESKKIAESSDGVYVFRTKCSIFGNNAPKYSSLPAEQRYNFTSQTNYSQNGKPVTPVPAVYPHDWDKGISVNKNSDGSRIGEGNMIYLDNTYPKISPDSWLVLQNSLEAYAYQISATTEMSVTDFALTAKVTRLTFKISVRKDLLGNSLIDYNNKLFMAWKDETSDVICYSTFFRDSWAEKQHVHGIGSSQSPSLAVYNNKLYMAWKGRESEKDDKGIYYSTFDGDVWTHQKKVQNTTTSKSPSLAVYNNKLYIAWKEDGEGIWYNTFDGNNWAEPQQVPKAKTDQSPSLAVYNNKLYIAWKEDGEGIWYNTFDGNNWAEPQQVPKAKTDQSPSLAVYNNKLYMAWKGRESEKDDKGIYYSTFDGNNWAEPQQVPKAKTDQSPSLAVYNNKLYIAWKEDGEGIWYTSYGIKNNIPIWESLPPHKVRGITTSHGPSLVYIQTPDLGDFKIRETLVYAQPEKLTLAEIFYPNAIKQNEILLDKMIVGLQIGQPILISGELADQPGINKREIAFLENIIHFESDMLTTLKLSNSTPLKYNYNVNTVTINANLVLATHGDTKLEAIGSGDPTQRFQQFQLKQYPLTFVPAPTASGIKTTLAVTVEGITWNEVDSFENLSSSENAYLVKIDRYGKTNIIFGDGVNGKLPPSGLENIKAKYRIGIGSSGIMDADKISLLMKKPLGIRSVTNPLSTTGGVDPENIADARKNAPRTALILDRIVSLEDYKNFTQGFAGIGKAASYNIRIGGVDTVLVAVASPTGNIIDETSKQTLIDAISTHKDLTARFLVKSFNKKIFNIEARILASSDRKFEDAMSKVEDTLKEVFSFDARDFGQAVDPSEVISVIQGVKGVDAVKLDYMYEYDPAKDVNSQKKPPQMIRASAVKDIDDIDKPSILSINFNDGITLGRWSET